MSAFAGTWYFDDRPIARHEAVAIDLALEPHGPDGSGSHIEPGLLMVHRALHVTAEDRAERQPHRGPEFVITWDGRLDNRSDLLMQLGAPARTGDADLVALAYARWKLDAFPRLIGDWSCAIWDRSERRLHLASDFMGTRPLFWQKTGQCIRWSTSLATFPSSERVLDDDYILGFLLAGPPPDRTPYRGIESLSSGHVLTCTAPGAIARTQYYRFPQVRLEYRDERD
jgi:asparagine synthase (glutamine-hydrolysing)